MTKDLLIAARPSQWIKNLFVFCPLLFGGRLFDGPVFVQVLLGFLLFCLTASAVYLLNDVLDRKEDRQHPLRNHRPIAAGRVTVAAALWLAAVLIVVALLGGYVLNPLFAKTLLVYIGLNIFYSLYLRQVVILDVFSLGAFFLLRIVAGTVIAQVIYSHWMIVMVVLLAMFLGFNKRRQEIAKVPAAASTRSVLRRYTPYFIDQIIGVLTASIVVCYLQYTVDSQTIEKFHTNHLLYTVPFVYYGIFRYLFLVHREGDGQDPTAALLKDGPLAIDILLWAATCVAVIYFKL